MNKITGSKNKFGIKIFSLAIFFFATLTKVSFAADQTFGSCNTDVRSFKDLIMNLVIGCVLSNVVYVIVSLAVIVFLWGVFKFIRSEGDDKQQGREFMLYGIIGLFVMISLWGLVSILQNTFNLTSTDITPRQVEIQPF